MGDSAHLSRRAVLGGALAGAAAWGLGAGPAGAAARSHAKLRGPGSLPNPAAPPGSDQLPEITAIIVVMMENHTYDSVLGHAGPR